MPRQRKPPRDFQFAGYQTPQYTPTPDQLFDELPAPGLLSNGELRVLLYLVRWTFGFKKAEDRVSISQIVEGILTKDGRRLDWGAGVARSTAIEAIQGLEGKGIVQVERTESVQRGFETNTYSLRLRVAAAPPPSPNTGLPLSEYRTRGGRNTGPALVRMPDPQETVVQETDSQEDSNQPAPQKKRTPRRNGADTPASAAAAALPVSQRDTPAPAPPYSAYIAGVVQDHSTDLGDGTHWRANVTQALRLWQASGLDEETFVAHLHAARQLVRTYQGKQGTGTIANKMGYYFRVLADLAGVPTELGAGR